MSKISELSDGGALQSTDYLIAVRSGGNVKVQPGSMSVDINGGTIDGVTIGGSSAGAITGTTGQFNTSLNVDGTVTADGLTVENASGSTIILSSTDTTLVDDQVVGRIQFDGSDGSGAGAGTKGSITVASADAQGFSYDMKFAVSDTSNNDVTRLTIGTDGDISFYEDTGTTPKFFWDASAEALGIGTSSPSSPLHIYKATGNPFLNVETLNSSGFFQAFSSVGLLIGTGSTKTNKNIDFYPNETFAARIDSSGNVGIGTSSPDDPLHVKDDFTSAGITLERGGNNFAKYRLSASSDTFIITDTRQSTECLRIDSSQNLLVGTTSAFPGSVTNVAAVHLGGATPGRGYFSNDGGRALNLNRMNSDGDIIEFRKDSTPVGSIGSFAGAKVYIGSPSSAGAVFATNGVMPVTDGSLDDNAHDLGQSSARWKDLYLSGGVYLGGTGAANKLEDYEEGTFTPQLADATSGGNTASGIFTGSYTKIGRFVYCFIGLQNINKTGMTSGNNLYFRNLPFTTAAFGGDAGRSHTAVRCDNINFDNYVVTDIGPNVTAGAFANIIDSASDTVLKVSDILASGTSDIFFTVTYMTDA